MRDDLRGLASSMIGPIVASGSVTRGVRLGGSLCGIGEAPSGVTFDDLWCLAEVEGGRGIASSVCLCEWCSEDESSLGNRFSSSMMRNRSSEDDRGEVVETGGLC